MRGWREKQAMRLVLGTPSNGTSSLRCDQRAAGHRSDENTQEGHTEEIEDLLATHFETQVQNFPYDQVKRLLENVEPETQGDSYPEQLNDVLTDWLRSGREIVEDALSALLAATAITALSLCVAKYAQQYGLKLQPGVEMLARLGYWAQQRAAEFLKQMERAIMAGLKSLISTALKSGSSLADIADRIKGFLKDWLERVKRIAVDEAIAAQEHGNYEANLTLGATTKQWFTVKDERVCSACKCNEAQGSVPITDPFASGHQYPPAHLLCRCGVQYDGVTRDSALHAFD